jgi:hypothetical protein
LNITVGGVPFVLSDDTGFGGPFPDVTFDALGHLSQIDYQGQHSVGGVPFTLDMTGSGGGVNLGVDLAAFYQGPVGSPQGLISVGVAAVPEPGTASLLAAALLAIGFVWRRRAANDSATSVREADGIAA